MPIIRMISALIAVDGMTWLNSEFSPNVASTAENASTRRDARRHHGAEGEQQDDQGQRQGHRACVLEVLADLVVEDVRRAGLTELLDGEAGMLGGQGLDRVHDRDDVRVGLGLVALDLEGDERSVTAVGDLAVDARLAGIDDLLHLLVLLERGDHVVDGGAEAVTLDGRGRARDQHHLVGALLEARLVDDLRGVPGFAVPGLAGLEVDLARHGTADDGDDDESEPQPQRSPPVADAPAADAGSQVLLGIHCSSRSRGVRVHWHSLAAEERGRNEGGWRP